MTDSSETPPPFSWRHHVSGPRRKHRVFSSSGVTVGAIHIGGMIAGILAADSMKSPATRWSAIAGFGIATGIGEAFWRERIERERDEADHTEKD